MLTIMFTQAVPINSLAWSLAAIIAGFYSWRLWLSYKTSGNHLSKLFAQLNLIVALALGAMSLPVYFTLDLNVLRWWLRLSDALIYVIFIHQSRIIWFIGLKNKLAYGWLLTPVILLSAISWYLQFQGAELTLARDLLLYVDPPLVSYLHVALMFLAVLPAGPLFFRIGYQARRAGQSWLAALKSYAIGLAYLTLGGGYVVTSLLTHGADTVASSWLTIISVVIIFFVIAIPPLKSRRGKPAGSSLS